MNIHEIITKYQFDLQKIGWGMEELKLLHDEGLIKASHSKNASGRNQILIDVSTFVQLMELCA